MTLPFAQAAGGKGPSAAEGQGDAAGVEHGRRALDSDCRRGSVVRPRHAGAWCRSVDEMAVIDVHRESVRAYDQQAGPAGSDTPDKIVARRRLSTNRLMRSESTGARRSFAPTTTKAAGKAKAGGRNTARPM